MANALNGITTAVPPVPRRNHATPVTTCAALAAAHHGQLLDSPPPGPRSPISAAAATRVFDGVGGGGEVTDRWDQYVSLAFPTH
jgi:hypothetical protein